MVAVVQPEVAGHAGQKHEIGFLEGLASFVAHLQRVVAAKQPARHAGQVNRRADGVERRDYCVDLVGNQRCLAADQNNRTLRLPQPLAGFLHLDRIGDLGRNPDGRPGAAQVGACKQPVHMPPQVPVDRLLAHRFPLAGRAIHFAHHGLVVEQIDRRLHEDGAGRAGLRLAEGLLQRGNQVLDASYGHRPLDNRGEERHLVDVLERAAALERGGRRAADEDDRRLRHLCILDGRQRVSDAGAGRHCGDAGPAGQARGRVGRKDRGGLVARVHDLDAARFGSHQNG